MGEYLFCKFDRRFCSRNRKRHRANFRSSGDRKNGRSFGGDQQFRKYYHVFGNHDAKTDGDSIFGLEIDPGTGDLRKNSLLHLDCASVVDYSKIRRIFVALP